MWGILLGLYRDNGKENGNYYSGLHRVQGPLSRYGDTGMMEKKMETAS